MSQKRHSLESAVRIRALATGYSRGTVLEPHAHDWHQLVYASEGVMGVAAEGKSWVVPPQRAVWVPAGVVHSVEMVSDVRMRTLYLARRLSPSLPRACAVVNVSPLLRELILHIVRRMALDRRVPADARLIGLTVDLLRAIPAVPLALTLPRDPRAARVAALFEADPAEPRPLAELARAAGASKRTLERAFRDETGMSFGRWRQQLRLLHATRLLAAGDPVTSVALDVGYDSVSAFIAAFRRVFGTTPGRTFA